MIRNKFFSLEYITYYLLIIFYGSLLVISKRNFFYIIPLIFIFLGIIINYKAIFLLPKKRNNYLFVILTIIFIYAIYSLILAFIHRDSTSTIKDEIILLLFPLILLYFQKVRLKPSIIWKIFAFTIFILFIVALYDKFILGIDRVFYNRIPLTLLTASGIIVNLGLFCLLIAIYYLEKKYFYSLIYFSFFLIALIVSLLTGSRGTWLSIIIIVPSIVWFYRKRIPKNLLLIVFITLFIMLSILFLFKSSGLQMRFHQMITDLSWYLDGTNKNTSIGLRFEFWKSAILGFIKYPLFGIGDANYQILKYQQALSGDIIPETIIYTHAHNQFLDILVKKGIFAFILLIMIFVYLLKFFIYYINNIKILTEQKIIAQIGVINTSSIIFHCLSDVFLNIQLGAVYFIFTTILLIGILINYEKN